MTRNCASAREWGDVTLTGAAQMEYLVLGDVSQPTYALRCEPAPQNRALQVAQAAHDEFVKRVPGPAVKTSGPPMDEPTTLVNLQTILWVDTGTDRDLGTADLLGEQVALRVHLENVSWDFGDGETDSTSAPGHAYDEHWSKCDTKLCPDYYGHIYRKPGHVRVRATVTWSGQYSVNGGPWVDIPGTADGATTELPIWVRESRAILVPNPGD